MTRFEHQARPVDVCGPNMPLPEDEDESRIDLCSVRSVPVPQQQSYMMGDIQARPPGQVLMEEYEDKINIAPTYSFRRVHKDVSLARTGPGSEAQSLTPRAIATLPFAEHGPQETLRRGGQKGLLRRYLLLSQGVYMEGLHLVLQFHLAHRLRCGIRNLPGEHHTGRP